MILEDTKEVIRLKLKIRRVVYGKESTPVEDREYNALGVPFSPVGTVKEWEKFAKEKGMDGVEVIELVK